MDIGAFTDNFVARYNGKKIDEDGYYGTQCWDVPARFAKELGVPSFPTGSGGAEGVYRLFLNPLPQFFDRIANSPDPNNIPVKGDIVVWTSAISPPWGHIAVVISANSNSMQVFEQNGGIDPNGDGIADGNAYIINRGYSNVAGWLRFKNQKEAISVEFKRQVTRMAYALYLNRGLSIKEYTSRDAAETPDAIMAEIAGSGEAFNTWKKLAAAFQVNVSDDWIRQRQSDYNNSFPLMTLFAASDLPNRVQILGKQLTDANTNIAALTGQIAELNKRPTTEQLDALKSAADTANTTAKKAQADLEAKLAKDQQTDEEALGVLRSLWRKITGGGS